MKNITIGIPAYKAEGHICDALSSINIQTVRDDVSVIIAKDNPDDDYTFVLNAFPTLDITILDCEKNTGPGLARQRCLDACTTPWITFMDADDVLFTPFALEDLFRNIDSPNCIEVQGVFYQEITGNPQMRVSPRTDVGHPWVFGRLYNAKFLKESGIAFSKLRAMEDGEFNWKIRMTIEGSPLYIKMIDSPTYLWRTGSEHSITRIGIDEKGIPQYNFDLCQWGATEAAIGAVNFCRTKNPFNGSINRFVTEIMVGHYFTYVECVDRKPIFAEQNFYNAKRFYHECFKQIEHLISHDVLKEMYTAQMTNAAFNLIGIVPDITFFDFMKKVKEDSYGGEEEFKLIRAKLPQEILDNDLKSGVLGRE